MKEKLCMDNKQFFDEYILVAPGSDYGRAMWSDIALLDNGKILGNALKPVNKFLSVLHHMHFSFVINRRIKLPFQHVWKHLYSVEGITFDEKKRYCIIYTDVSAARTDHKYLKNLSNQSNITMVLVMVNTMARRDFLLKERIPLFSMIFSFDEEDSREYGFIYHPTNYSMMEISHNKEIRADAFFVGVSKGRASTLASIYLKLIHAGAKAEFFIADVKKGETRYKGIHYNKWLTYQDVLQKISECNCVVEVMDGNQKGVTLRTMEAICYNKKLLTNNQLMKQSKYYKSGNIQVFSSLDNIDVEFIKDRGPVNYGYDGEFSPIHLLEHINQIIAEKE